MNICFVIESKYQLLNCLNYIFHQNEFDNVEYDAIICINNIDLNIIEKLKMETIFRNIVRYNYNGADSCISKLLEVVFTRFYVSYRCVGTLAADYDVIFIATPFRIPADIVFINRKARVFYYEDGTSSYYKKMLPYSKVRLMTLRIIGKKPERLLNPERMYVNNKVSCKTNHTEHIYNLFEYDNQFLEIVKKIFQYKENNVYKRYNYIFLTQPMEEAFSEIADPREIENEVNKILLNHRDEVLVRVHPRMSKENYECFIIDRVENQWELESYYEILEDSVLIGFFSTSQFIPKWIYDKEPYIVLLFPLYKDYIIKWKYEAFIELVMSMQQSYRKKKKIIMIDSLEKLERVFEKGLVK